MSRSLKNWFHSRQSRKQPARCSPLRARLEMEPLEKREVLSTASASYVLIHGNLYHKPAAATTLIDRAVRSFQADGHGDVAVLEQTGDLKYYSKPTLTAIDSGVTTYQLDTTGTLLELDSQGNFQRYTPAAGTVLVESGVQSFAIVSSGRVYLLQMDGTLLGSNDGQPGDFTPIDTGAQAFAATSAGRVYVLQHDGSFLVSDNGLPNSFASIDTAVRSFALASTGRVYLLHSDGTFLTSSDGQPGDFTQVDTGVQSIALESTGRIYELESGGLLLSSATGLARSFTVSGRMVNSISLSNGSLVVNDWFSQHLNDAGVAAVARKKFALHDALTFSDLLWLFRQAESGKTVSADQLLSLRAVVANASLLNISAADEDLASKTVNGNPADSHYHGHRISALSVGSSSLVLRALVSKWFIGQDHPAASSPYEAVSGALFARSGPSYGNAVQGDLGDCWLIAALAETADRMPSIIKSMFIANPNHTWTVRFYINGVADYVTVDDQLPDGGNLYDKVPGMPLWVALAEKAFAQENASGQFQTAVPGANSYGALNGGDAMVALAAITGLPTNDFSVDPSSVGAAWQQGKLIALSTPARPASGSIVPDHCYAVVGYNKKTGAITLFNPWGVGGGYSGANGAYYPGYVTVSKKYMVRNFDEITTSGMADNKVEEHYPCPFSLPSPC
jgi:hypothetical protein